MWTLKVAFKVETEKEDQGKEVSQASVICTMTSRSFAKSVYDVYHTCFKSYLFYFKRVIENKILYPNPTWKMTIICHEKKKA